MKTMFLKNKTVQKRLWEIAVVTRRLKTVYENEVRKLKHDAEDIQARCKHEQVKYMADPAGDSDSWWCCEVCDYMSRMKIEPDEKRACKVVKKNRDYATRYFQDRNIGV